jgi:hypothetical protein
VALPVLAGLALGLGGAGPGEPEHRLKAAVLCNLAKFTEWPVAAVPAPGSPWVIGVLGADPFGAAIDEMVRLQTVQGHPLAVQRLTRDGKWSTCHLLFIARSESDRLAQVLAALGEAPVLTVSDVPQAAERGVMINLVVKEGLIRFEINTKAVERAALRVSSKVLKYATIVSAPTEAPSP